MQKVEVDSRLFETGDWPIFISSGIEKCLRETRAGWKEPEDWERSMRRWQSLILEFLIDPREFRFLNPQPGQSLSLQGFVTDSSKRVYPLDLGKVTLSALVIPGFDSQKTEGQIMSGLRLHPQRRAIGIGVEALTDESIRMVMGRIRDGCETLIPCSGRGWLGEKEPTRGFSSERLSITAESLTANPTGVIVGIQDLSRVTVVKPFAEEPLRFEMETGGGSQISGTIPRYSPLSTFEARGSLNLLAGSIVKEAIKQVGRAVK